MNKISPWLAEPPVVRRTKSPGVTREMVHQRTRELTAIAGREPRQVRQADYEQAMRELTGETDGDRQQAVLDAPVEDDRDPADCRRSCLAP